MINVFDYEQFAEFIKDLSESRGTRGGMKQELSEAMGSHPGYLSRVLSGQAQLSLEQAERIASHMRMGEEEKRYLLFLLQEERAATKQLKKIFREERDRLRHGRLNLKTRIPDSKQVSMEDQAIYYSAWHHSAVHVLVSIPKFKDVESVAEYLQIPLSTVRESIIFLERAGIIQRTESRWTAGEYHLHLERTSPFIRQHHANFRLKCAHALDRMVDADLRYSGMFSISEADAAKLKEKMVKHLQDYISIVKSSSEEKPYVFAFDFFQL